MCVHIHTCTNMYEWCVWVLMHILGNTLGGQRSTLFQYTTVAINPEAQIHLGNPIFMRVLALAVGKYQKHETSNFPVRSPPGAGFQSTAQSPVTSSVESRCQFQQSSCKVVSVLWGYSPPSPSPSSSSYLTPPCPISSKY